MALLSRQANSVDAGKPLGISDIPHELIDARFELCNVAEHGNVDRNDHMSGIGRRRIIVVEIDDIASHRRES